MHGLVDSLLWLKDFILFLPTSSQVDKVFQFSQSQFDRRLAKVCLLLILQRAVRETKSGF